MKKSTKTLALLVLALSVLWYVCVFLVDVPLVQERNKGSMRITRERIQIIQSACERFNADCERYPTQIENLHALCTNPNVLKWKGPYLTKIPVDFWGNSFSYFLNYDAQPLIISAGPDETFNTSDDISN